MKLVLYLSPENAVFFQLNLFLREQGFFLECCKGFPLIFTDKISKLFIDFSMTLNEMTSPQPRNSESFA